MNASARIEHSGAMIPSASMIHAAPSLERRRLRAYLGLVVADVIGVVVGFLVASAAYSGRLPDPHALLQAYLLLPIYLTIALYRDAYSIRTLLEWRFASGRALGAMVISAALLAFVAFYLKASANFSRATLTLGLVLAGAFLVAVRVAAVASVRRRWRGFVRNRLLVLDDGPELDIGANHVIDAAVWGLDPAADDPHALDRLGRALLNQDEVLVSCSPARREQWAWTLKASGARGEIISETAHDLGALGVRHYEAADVTTVVVSAGPLGLRSRAIKRLFDVALALGGLVILSPLLLFVALLVWLEDRGPVLFVQQRTGRGNRFFVMLKFRSLKVQQTDASGIRSVGRDDARLTRIGGFLRRTSIDELPQLLNVLRGDMSIVGPRPHAVGSLAGDRAFWQVDRRYWHRHALKPGLTGLAQVRGLRGATGEERDLSERLQADLEYLANWSLWGDLGIVLRTLLVLRHERAF